MTSRSTRRFLARLALAALAAASPAAFAADPWPTKTLRVVVAFPPGGPGDVVVRLLQPYLQQALGQSVIVDNKPGAGGNLGAREVARATDGHTVLLGPDTMITVNPHIYRKLTFKPQEDLVPISFLVRYSQLLACNPGTGFKTLADFRAAASKGNLNYASGGQGVPGHVAMELLQDATGMNLTHVPYRGPTPAAQDVIGGSVPCGFLATSVVGPHVREGRLVGLAVSGGTRTASLPSTPTVAEAGVAGFDATFHDALWAPRSMPAAHIDRFQQALTKALSQPEVRARLTAADMEPVGSTSAEAQRSVHADFEKWGRVLRKVNLQVD